VMMNDEPYTLF